jgi:ATP-binding cassette subfamily C protein
MNQVKLTISPFLHLVSRTPTLRRATTICVALTLVASAAEITVALALLPILASLNVDAGEELSSFVKRLSPFGWLVLFALAAVSRSVVNWQASIQEDRGHHELSVSLQSRLYRALAGAHWDAVRRISPPALTNALQTQAYMAGDGFSSLIRFTSATLLVVGYIVSAAFVFPLTLPLVLGMLLVIWRLNAGTSSRVLEHSKDYYEAQEGLHSRYEDWVAISHVASLGVDAGKLADRFEVDACEAAGHSVNVGRSFAFTRITYDATVATAILIGVPIAWQLETPPALLAFGLVLLIRVLPRVAGIHGGYQGIIRAVAPIRTIDELTEQLEGDPAMRVSAAEPLEWRQLELKGIGVEDTMRQSGRRWILRGIDLELRHGDWLAITGPTGAGKTTLANVMLTLIRPDAGQISVDDREIDDKLASRWRSQAAYVPQDVVLFDASIRDNLRLFAPEATDDELEAALRRSAADFVFERLPEGLDTQVGPGGHWLSGGERQRIGIARALLRRPGFLVLDEPTAALDTITQEKLMDALSRLDHKMSVVFITHRPELLRLADHIIGIEDGEITRRDDGFRRSDSAPLRP